MGYFDGLDMALRSCGLCIVDARGGVAFEHELACDIGEIIDCLERFSQPIERVGFGATTMSQHLS